MNSPTMVDELKRRLADEKLANKHLNAVLKGLQDELTAAKLEINELKQAVEDAHLEGLETREMLE